jgi:hypothetical protein
MGKPLLKLHCMFTASAGDFQIVPQFGSHFWSTFAMGSRFLAVAGKCNRWSGFVAVIVVWWEMVLGLSLR